ncbi:hypothetical protein BAE44_0021914 [Dichanthelium oligosanthes]|uniref:Uncharacterized protein n=1 Tax=Dichanthelium oligosanthes TaxID=888268 RepID=A0A1E5UW06_9POAL|nr:hypothetical protein BAE44_0021914 [Dichanthelium oligosanthes]
MATPGSSRGLISPACSSSPPHLSVIPPLSNPATTMSPPGGGRVGGFCNKNPAPQGVHVHPRYVPKRGSVLKGILRGMLRCFLLTTSQLAGEPASSGGRRVRPAPAEAGGDGAEQGK